VVVILQAATGIDSRLVRLNNGQYRLIVSNLL